MYVLYYCNYIILIYVIRIGIPALLIIGSNSIQLNTSTSQSINFAIKSIRNFKNNPKFYYYSTLVYKIKHLQIKMF